MKEELDGISAQELGKLGGSVKSEKKANAVRENGKKGGRPKKNKDKKIYKGGWFTDKHGRKYIYGPDDSIIYL